MAFWINHPCNHLQSRLTPRSRVGVAALALALLLFGSATAVAQSESLDAEVVVKATPLSELTTAQRQFAPATVQAANRASVAARVSANIERVEAEVGQSVKKGELLARLDATDFDLALEQAKAQLASTDAQIQQANLRLKRAKELSGNQYISADDLLGRETDVVVLTATRAANRVSIRVAENEVAKTRVEAPFDAVVVSRSAQVGSFVTPGTPLFSLVQLDGPEIEASVATDLINSVRSGKGLRFERNGQFWPLRLERISPVVVTDSGAQLVRASFTQEAAPVGSSGRVSWLDEGGLIPADILVRRDKELGVFVVNGDRARFVPIEGAQEGRPAATSLSLDSRIVTLGRFKLQDGQRLKLVND